MATGYFRFKQFIVHQEHTAFKVTTDSVLLGAWAAIADARTILDIGTGTGLLALMAAQRTEAQRTEAQRTEAQRTVFQRSSARIVAIEPDRNSFMQAGVNFGASPWYESLTLIHTLVQDFRPEPDRLFDAIITNPPYFVDSLPNPDKGKAHARHTLSMSHADLAVAAARLLAPAGSLHLVLPVNEAGKFTGEAAANGLHCVRRMLVRPTPDLPPARALMTLRLGAATVCEESELVIEKGGRHIYSDEYVSLTKDFYLKF